MQVFLLTKVRDVLFLAYVRTQIAQVRITLENKSKADLLILLAINKNILDHINERMKSVYKVIFTFSDGREEEDDEIFETEEEANDYGLESCGNIVVGREILHMSNPGDYPLEDTDVDFYVVEVEG